MFQKSPSKLFPTKNFCFFQRLKNYDLVYKAQGPMLLIKLYERNDKKLSTQTPGLKSLHHKNVYRSVYILFPSLSMGANHQSSAQIITYMNIMSPTYLQMSFKFL